MTECIKVQKLQNYARTSRNAAFETQKVPCNSSL